MVATVFTRDFDAEMASEAQARQAAAERRFSEADLRDALAEERAAAREEGRIAGHAEGRAEALGEIAARAAEALEALGPQLETFLGDTAARQSALEAHLVSYVLRVADKLLPEFAAARGPERAAAEARALVERVLGCARLSLRLHPALADRLGPELVAMAERAGQARHLDVCGDPELAPGAVQLRWEDGMMAYSFDEVCRAIRAELHRTQTRYATPMKGASNEPG